MSARCYSCQAALPDGAEICDGCRTTFVPRIDLESPLGSGSGDRPSVSHRVARPSDEADATTTLPLDDGSDGLSGERDLLARPAEGPLAPYSDERDDRDDGDDTGKVAHPLLGQPGSDSGAAELGDSDPTVPFCGRGLELGRLGSLIEQAMSQQRLRCALIHGPLGVGKSRLLRELGALCVDHLGLPADRVLVGTMPGEEAAAASAFTEQLKTRCDILPGEQSQSAREKLLRTCRALLPAVRATEVAHCLGELLGVPFPDSPTASSPTVGAQPALTEPRVYVAIKRFFAADAARRPLVLLFDEMEHASDETISLLYYLVESLLELPVFVGVFASPDFLERHADCGGAIGLVKVELAPLSPPEASELFCHAVHAPPSAIPESLLAAVEAHSEGSPRKLVELVALLRETGALYFVPALDEGSDDDPSGSSGIRGQWEPEALERLLLPPALEMSRLVEARLSALEPRLRSWLEMAAVCGEHFYLDALLMLERCSQAGLDGTGDGTGDQANDGADDAVADRSGAADPEGPALDELIDADDRAVLQSGLELLQRRGLIGSIRDSRLRGEREFRFAYPPWRDIVYGTVPPGRRRRYHHLLAHWLLLHRDADNEEQLETVARHMERAGRATPAAYFYRQVAKLAALRGAYNKAPRLLLRALACLGSGDIGMRIGLWHDLGAAMVSKGDFDAGFSAYEKMLRLAHALALREQLAEGHYAIGQLHRLRGEPSPALEHLTRAYDEWTALADSNGVSKALDDLGQVLWLLGRTDEALDRAGRALELRRRLGDRKQVAASLLHIGAMQQHRGLLDPAVSCYEEALRKHDGDRQLLAACHEALGSIALIRGDLDGARSRFEEGLGQLETLGPSPLHAVLACRQGEALLLAGRLDEADSQLQTAQSVALRLADRRALAEIERLLALVQLRRDQPKAAEGSAQRALLQAQKNGVRHEIARALLTLGEVHAATLFDETAEGAHPAWDCFRRSVALLREVGDRAELALALYQLARHLIERGRLGPAKNTLREAAQLATALKMRLASDAEQMLAEL